MADGTLVPLTGMAQVLGDQTGMEVAGMAGRGLDQVTMGAALIRLVGQGARPQTRTQLIGLQLTCQDGHQHLATVQLGGLGLHPHSSQVGRMLIRTRSPLLPPSLQCRPGSLLGDECGGALPRGLWTATRLAGRAVAA